MNRLGIALFAFLLFPGGCKDLGSEPTPYQLTDDIREAVFRQMFQTPPSGSYGDVSAYYLSFCTLDSLGVPRNRQDPPTEFLTRFRGFPLPVKMGSECHSYPLVDINTGEPGMWFYVGSLEVLDENTVRVGAGDAFCLARYYLTRNGGVWTVTRWGIIWIS
jgi:hypothetical protein